MNILKTISYERVLYGDFTGMFQPVYDVCVAWIPAVSED
ncbi:MAG: hypothetical protein LW692_04545 [Sphingobacteriales bacterium]|nr:hypothetical protein [Sphingobacteriales bacterium]